MKKALKITAAEWDVMEVVWEQGPCVAAVIIERLHESHDWNHRTIRTMLARLVDKSVLDFVAEGSKYIYRAAVTRQRCVRQESRSFTDKVFGGDIGSLLVHFVSNEKLSSEQIERLRAILDEKQSPSARN